MKFAALVCLLLSSCVIATVPEKPEQRGRIELLTSTAVKVKVDCDDGSGSGSGVIISSDLSNKKSAVLTAAHMDEGGNCKISVVNVNQLEFPAKVVRKSVDFDLLLLEVEGNPGPVTPVAFDSFVGENVTCVGYPHQRHDGEVHLSVTKGTIATKFKDVDRITADMYFGSSGGMCVDDDNALVGIMIFMYAESSPFGLPSPVTGQFFIANAESINTFLE
jgi:S1-C subfamily serine protease